MNAALNRRQFLRQSFAFSALATLGAHPAFSLAPDAGAQHILALGDFGWPDPAGQRQVAAAMQQYATHNKLQTEALLMLGDTFYGALTGPDDPRWKSQFEDMYPATAFPSRAYSIMGNHDYQVMGSNKLETELAYAARGKTRFTAPALYYSFHLPAKDPLLRIIALDSNVGHANAQTSKGFYVMSAKAQAAQLEWFAAEIAKPSTAPFTIVMGHHPIFSNGPHGDNEVLIKEWEPLLRKHKAHIYLAGHDHDLQHLEFEGHPTSFVCSGAGGANLYDLKIAQDARGPYAHKVYGFTHFEITPTKLTIRHVDSDAKVVHAFTKGVDHSVAMLA